MAADKTKEGTGSGVATTITAQYMATGAGMPISSRKGSIEYIAIHYTAGGNSKKGRALTCAKHFNKNGGRASADFAVDDAYMVQVNPDPTKWACWAVGDPKKNGIMGGKARNMNCVSIEICSSLAKGGSAKHANHTGWYYTQGALNNALQLTRTLMKKYKIDINHVIRHYAVSTKLCPGIIGWNNGEINSNAGKGTGKMNDSSKWNEFKKKVANGSWYGDIKAPTMSADEIKAGKAADSASSSSSSSMGSVGDSGDTSIPSAITDVTSNTYQNIMPAVKKSATDPVRIYKAVDPAIKLDEFSVPLNGQDSPVDTSTGQHIGDKATSESDDKAAADTKPAGHGVDKTFGMGTQYPGIQINDWVASQKSILKMELECSGFVPTLQLELQVGGTDLMKKDLCKEGDHINLFINPGHGTLKSLRLDFLITKMITPKFKQYSIEYLYNYTIFGELNIPGLYNTTGFAFSGTSRDALVDVAKRLNLGFFISDDENTNDSQMWYCVTEDDEQDYGGQASSTVIEYMQNTIAHAWKDENSFYDGWIDFRYSLTFLNVNRILGASGKDEMFDVTVFNSIFVHNKTADNKHGSQTDAEKKENPTMQIKMITNIPQDPDSATAFYAIDFNVVDQAHQITQQIGTQMESVLGVSNSSQDNGMSSVNMAYSIIYNKDKYDPEDKTFSKGYYIMMGPGKPENHVIGQNQSYVSCNKKISGSGTIQDTQSDCDGTTIAETGDNMQASGNTNKFYDTAQQHNYINNMQLKKKYMRVTLNGVNLAVMRGEKIPVIMLDNNKLQSAIGMNVVDSSTDTGLNESDQLRINRLNQMLFTDESGWFMIQSVKYIYTVDNHPGTSNWSTELVLTRREWPIPGYGDVFSDENGKVYLDDIIEASSASSSTEDQSAYNDELAGTDDETFSTTGATDGTQTTNGLEDYMISVYQAIQAAAETAGCPIKLVGARRWALDENGNRIDGGAYVMESSGTYLLCIDTTNVIMYMDVSQKQNMHLFGRAIDITTEDDSKLDDLVKKVLLLDPTSLLYMYKNGVSCFLESTLSSGRTVKHYHVGTNTGYEETFWKAVKTMNGNVDNLKVGDETINLNNFQQNLKQAPTATLKQTVKLESGKLDEIKAKYKQS